MNQLTLNLSNISAGSVFGKFWTWKDYIINDEPMTRVGLQNMSDIVRAQRLRLAGHILITETIQEARPANVAMNWTPQGGTRRRRRPQKT